jgi:hypothetical protein
MSQSFHSAVPLILRQEFRVALCAERGTPRTSPNPSQLAMPTVSRWDLASMTPKPASDLRTRTNGRGHLEDWAA